MLCRIGRITKQEIGAIKMQAEETYVEIAADWTERFNEAVGPKRMLEKGITVTQLNGMPDLSGGPRGGAYAGKKPAKGGDWKNDGKPKRKFDARPDFAGADQRSSEKADTKPWTKKPGKPGFDKSGFEKAGSEKPKFDKPGFDKPKFDKPKSEKPKFAKPGAEGVKRKPKNKPN